MPGKPSQGRPLCRATTAAGKPCRNRAASGSAFCSQHGGAKRPIGRPTKLNPATVATICASVALGNTLELAAQAAGIDRTTLHTWRERGEDDLAAGRDTLFATFVDLFTRAQAEGEANLVQAVRSHVLTDWRAGAWLLERRAPERWSLKHRDGIDPATAERALPRDVAPEPEQRDALLELLQSATRPPSGHENTPGGTP